jgi:RNA ligase
LAHLSPDIAMRAQWPDRHTRRVMIDDLLDPHALDTAVQAGLVRVQRHPALPLRIFNYTEQAVFGREWTPVTRTCRGLVVADDGTVVARPWPKFFNHGEQSADPLDLAAPVEVTDKADGSLGILYPVPAAPDANGADVAAGYAVATRGSFSSEQALHATERYGERYATAWTPLPGWTYLVEIVYPENRIVLDYGDLDDLILLGAVEVGTGRCAGPLDPPCAGWPGPRTEVHDHASLAEALAAEPRPNAEGLVVRYLEGAHAGAMVKLKQDDYVALHRVVTGLTARRLWERTAVHAADEAGYDPRRIAQQLRLDPAEVAGILQGGRGWLDALRLTAPEEFTAWIDGTVAELRRQVTELLDRVAADAAPLAGLPRKEAAAAIAAHPYRGMLFAVLDGRPVLTQAWAAVRPEAERPYRNRSEDVA